MTIRFKKDRIEFENGTNKFVMFETPVGFSFNGRIAATSAVNPFQGVAYGYHNGGIGTPGGYTQSINRFSFATDGNASGLANLNRAKINTFGCHSGDAGYVLGDNDPTYYTEINKFPFATNVSSLIPMQATAVFGLREGSGHSSSTHGYTSGGAPAYNIISKFPFAIDTGNTTDIADLTRVVVQHAGQSSTTHGYASAGLQPPLPTVFVNTIDKFSFATDSNATDVGDVTPGVGGRGAGVSGPTSGYIVGGAPTFGAPTNHISKFPFSTDSNATLVAYLTTPTQYNSGHSSTVSGYTSGGGLMNNIEKFPFASDANSTDVGDLNQYGQGSKPGCQT